MEPLKAQVRNGRLLLDEATDLPEGQVVELVPVDQAWADGDDDLDDEDRALLHESLAESLEQAKNGQLIDGADALAEIRAYR